jgi:hypothetical protein
MPAAPGEPDGPQPCAAAVYTEQAQKATAATVTASQRDMVLP